MDIKKFLIIHPSRGRPEMAMEAARNITASMRSGLPATYCLSIDSDDPARAEYCRLFPGEPVTALVVADNPHEAVQATNRAAALVSDEDLIVAHADDYRFTPGWDQKFIDCLATRPGHQALLYCPDYPVPGLAVPQVLTRALYRRLGYVFWPEYVSMYADNDLFEAASRLGLAVPCRPMPFAHLHPTFDNARPMDETTARTNAGWKYELGQRILARRRREGFNL